MAGEVLTGNNEDVVKMLELAVAKISAIDSATTKANISLSKYSDEFGRLTDQISGFTTAINKANKSKFTQPKLNAHTKDLAQSSSSYLKKSNNERKKVIDVVFKSVDSISGQYGKAVGGTLKKTIADVMNVKSLGSMAKSVTGLSSGVVAGTAAISGLTLALASMSAAGNFAYQKNMDVNRSLLAIGGTSNELSKESSKAANEMINIKNTWSQIGTDLGMIFEPVFKLATQFVSDMSTGIRGITSGLNEKSSNVYNKSDSKIRWYTSQLAKVSNQPESKTVPTIANIASSAKQSGFDNASAANLAIGTYDLAMKKAKEYGLAAEDVAKQLSEAWLSGSDAAKNYGVVVDDQTLIGYMASKGVDIVNTQISDAMKQYYRYGLMQEEVEANGSDAMQNQVKGWKQLGMQIDLTKNKLFGFDEVIQLAAVDTTIPEVGVPNVSYPNMGITDNKDNDKSKNNNITPYIELGNVIRGKVDTAIRGLSDNEQILTDKINENTDALGNNTAALSNNTDGLNVNSNASINNGDILDNLSRKLSITSENTNALSSSQSNLSNKFIMSANSGIMEANANTKVSQTLQVVGQSADVATSKMQSFIQTLNNAISRLSSFISLNSRVNLNSNTNLNTNMRTISGVGANLNTGTGLMPINSNVNYGNIGTKANTSARTNTNVKTGVTTGLLDMVTEFAGDYQDQMNSNGKYNFGKGVSNVIEGLLTTPKQIYDAATTTYGNVKNKTGSSLLGLAGGALGGLGYVVADEASDIVSTGLLGLQKLTGKSWDELNKSTNGGLSLINNLSNGAASLLTTKWNKPGFASGGIGSSEMTARLFEDNKKEAVIPLETTAGQDTLVNIAKAGLNESGGSGGDITINMSLTGIFDTDDNYKWNELAQKLGETIEIQNRRRGGLNYGGTF